MSYSRPIARKRRHERSRKKLFGTSERPRLAVYRSLSHLYAQLIDDSAGKTLLGVATVSKGFPHRKDAGNVKGAKGLGKFFAEKALEKKITQVIFDRGGFLYHGRVKAFAEGAREGGLKF